MCKLKLALFVIGAITVVSACTTTGGGYGTSRDGQYPSMTLSWTSADAMSGSMTAAFENGETFTGPYFQITSDVQEDRLNPLWNGWYGPRGGWPYWHAHAGVAFYKYYSGRMVANLLGSEGEHMRCRFHLQTPSEGMSGGGAGECQLPGSGTIDAVLRPAHS
jgi:hypothetical protein